MGYAGATGIADWLMPHGEATGPAGPKGATKPDAWNPEPHWPSDASMLERAVRNAPFTGRTPRWSNVANALAVGSTVATALCRRFGLDPDEIQKRMR